MNSLNTDLLQIIDTEATEIWHEINTGHDYVIIDSYEQFYGICVQIAETLLKSLNIEEAATEGAMVQIDRVLNVLDWAEEKGRISYSDWEDCYTIVASLKYRLKAQK